MANDTQAGGTLDREYVTLKIPKESAQPVRDLVRGHLQELPAQIRNDLQTQMNNWEFTGSGTERGGGQSGGARSQGTRESQR
jgi:hypothetical protein